MSGLKLFEITAQFKELERLTDNDELAPEFIADTLEGLQGDFEEKAVAVAKFILSLEANSKAIDEAAEAMSLRALRMKKRADSVRAYLLFNLQALDRMKISTAEINIARRNNPVAVQVSDETKVPKTFWRQPPAPPPQLDKKLIKEKLQAGEDIPGVYLESGERVEIKL
jgi:hypothetical protein